MHYFDMLAGTGVSSHIKCSRRTLLTIFLFAQFYVSLIFTYGNLLSDRFLADDQSVCSQL